MEQLVVALRYKPEEVVGSIHVGVDVPVALRLWGLTQLVTDVSTRNFCWGVKASIA